jgi:hypothetical protein
MTALLAEGSRYATLTGRKTPRWSPGGLELTVSVKTDVIRLSLTNAENWERQGNLLRANTCLTPALLNLLSTAVEECSDQAGAEDWLRGRDAEALLRRARTYFEHILGQIEGGRVPAAVLEGNYSHLIYAHLSWALRDYPLGEFFAAVARRKDVAGISTPFWREYARGVGCLVDGAPYQAPKLKLRGQEEYWASYLALIEAATAGTDLAWALARIDHAFRARNADRKIKDDHYQIEGSGSHPVRWDYRRDSLMNYISSRTPGRT